jgi:hypothetical protein
MKQWPSDADIVILAAWEPRCGEGQETDFFRLGSREGRVCVDLFAGSPRDVLPWWPTMNLGQPYPDTPLQCQCGMAGLIVSHAGAQALLAVGIPLKEA